VRLSPTESAQLVLERLRANEPRRPTRVDPHNHRPHVDPTFDARHKAWQAAIDRETARLQAEQQGTLDTYLKAVEMRQDQVREARLRQMHKEDGERDKVLRAKRRAREKKGKK
jgi:hypothetical protein